MSNIDRKYLDVIEDITVEGKDIQSRNSLTRRITTRQVKFSSTPLISVRRTAWKHALREMEWFLSGSSEIKDLHESVRHWWEPWANSDGVILNNYSLQFRGFQGLMGEVDQIEMLIKTLKRNPTSRRAVATTWQGCDMHSALTPITNCHGTVIQCFVNPDDTVDMTMYQRSADIMLGVPHNWIQYWGLLQYLCHQSGRKVGSFTWIGGDVHIYESHFNASEECRNTPISQIETPNLIYTPTSDTFKADDFSLDKEYKPLIKKSLKLIV